MSLNHIDSLEYTPKAKTQVIIGTNGSGKSSLLYELSPMPSHHRMYDHGLKQITIEHKGSTYVLTSDFTKGKSHSFIKDGVELNPGVGTYPIQKQLVQEHFGLTAQIHELMLGTKGFSSMSASERRTWFTMLSDTSYDYALGFYNRLKERLRDITGAIKVAKQRLSVETVKTYSKSEIAELQAKVKSLYTAVQTMQEMRIPVQMTVEEGIDKNEDIRSQIKHQLNAVKAILKPLKTSGYDIANIAKIVTENTATVAALQALAEQYEKDHKAISEKYAAITDAKDYNLTELLQTKENLLKELTELQSSYSLKLAIAEPQKTLGVLQYVVDEYASIYPALVEYLDSGYTVELKKAKETELEQLTERLNRCNKAEENSTGIIQHLKSLLDSDTVKCPNCKHDFIVGYDEQLLAKHLDIQKRARAKASELTNIKLKLTEELAHINEWYQARQALAKLVRTTPSISTFWDYCIADRSIDNPNMIHTLLAQYNSDILKSIQEHKLKAKLESINALITQAQKANDLNSTAIKKDKQILEEKISLSAQKLSIAKKELDTTQAYLASLKKGQQDAELLESLIRELKQNEKDTLEAHRRQGYNDFLRLVQTTLAKHEAQLTQALTHHKTIEELEKQIESLSHQEHLLKLIVKELSPTEGLIAEGLFGFMKFFIMNMNMIIKRIWSYPLVVKPCSVEDDSSLDLDYKFAVMVDTESSLRSDISEGSSAMREVIDLAFKITAMKALKMGDWPLFLDEFGSTMDPVHKAATISLINSLMQEEHFSQCFMISHDAVQYGALSNTEVLVLSEENMMLSEGSVYNQNVVIN